MPVLIFQILLFVILLLIGRIFKLGLLSFGNCGRYSMAGLFLFAGSAHFYLTKGMVEMVPPMIPQAELVVYASGVVEILAAFGLIFRQTAKVTSWFLILLLLAVLPANIYAAMAKVGLGGHVNGPIYLWFRIPLQLFWMGWLWYFRKRP